MALPVITHPEQNEDVLKSKGVSLNAFFDQVRIRKDKSATIRLRIIYNRFPKYYTTKISMSEEEYLKMLTPPTPRDLKEKRLIIFGHLKKAYDIIAGLPEFSFEAFEKKYNGKIKDSIDVFSSFEAYSAALKQEGRISSAITYDCALKSIKAFAKKESLPFNKITSAFLKEYEQYMLASGKSITTIGIYCRNLRKLMNDAIRDGKLKQESYPFGKKENGNFTILKSRKVKKSLSSIELGQILAYQPVEKSPEHYYYDLWIFSYLGNGMNLKDICLLKYKNIKGNSIKFYRSKTANSTAESKEIVVSIIERNKAIIDRWGVNPFTQDDYVFPEYYIGITPEQQRVVVQALTKQVNKYMKRIVGALEIKADITSYWARHTFSTVLKRSGVNISYISESLGHSNVATTENYLDGFEDDAREAITRKLLEY
jgi:integrase